MSFGNDELKFVYWYVADYNDCLSWGSCEQGCIDGAGTYNCSCYDGYTLQDDGHTCKVTESKYSYTLQDDGHTCKVTDSK